MDVYHTEPDISLKWSSSQHSRLQPNLYVRLYAAVPTLSAEVHSNFVATLKRQTA